MRRLYLLFVAFVCLPVFACIIVVPSPTSEESSAVEGKIAFSSNRDGNWEIYVMNADGSNQINLTNNPAEDRWPTWSPDGSNIAFSSNRDGNWEIYVMNADGSNQINLTNNPAHRTDSPSYTFWYDDQPAWSPDGAKIAFVSGRAGSYEIYVMDADGSNQAMLTNSSGPDWQPAWSPDGAKIAFASARDVNYEIYVMNADGSNQTRVIDGLRAEQDHPSWSPYNGGEITFAADYYDNWEICVVRAPHGIEHRLSRPADDMHPTWSSDGTKIAFATYLDRNWEIYVMNADGSNQINLTNNPANDDEPAWLTGGLAELPSITVISPNGGESWSMGTTKTIQWRYTGSPGPYVEVSLIKGGFFNMTITSSTPIVASGFGSYSWAIPTSLTPGTNYKIRIESTTDTHYFDSSDNDFSITLSVPSPPVSSPRPGRLAIDPVYDRNPVGTKHTATITVLGTDGKPLPNVRVYISHTGAHTFAPIELTTEADGKASYSYTGSKVGIDTIVARVNDLSATATKEWYTQVIERPRPGKITIDPIQDRNQVGTQHTVTVTVYDTNGKPMPNVRLYISHTGAHTFAPIELVTDQNGRNSYYYTGTNVGTDTIVARIDSLTATATKEWYSLQQPGTTGQATQPRQCPSECRCLTKAEAKIYGQAIVQCQPSPCGYDSQRNPKYCYKQGFATPPSPEVTPPEL